MISSSSGSKQLPEGFYQRSCREESSVEPHRISVNAATADQVPGINPDLVARSTGNNMPSDSVMAARKALVETYGTYGVTATWMGHLGVEKLHQLKWAFDLGKLLDRDLESWTEGYTPAEVIEMIDELEPVLVRRGISLPH